MIFVEGFRLFLVIAGAIAGLATGNSIDKHGIAPVIGLALGSFISYVIGGVAGRFLDKEMTGAVGGLRKMPPAEIFAGTVIGTAGLLLGIVAGLPLIALVHSSIDFPVVSAVAWVLAVFGVRLGIVKGRDMVRAAGISRLLDPVAEPPPTGMLVVDTSAVMDRYLLVLGRAGLLDVGLVLPRFVIDEVRTLAESPDPVTSRRARRGLEAVETLRVAGVDIRIDDEELLHLDDAGEKVVALATRYGLRVATCSSEVVTLAEEHAVDTLDLRRLTAELTPDHLPGERLVVDLIRSGRQARQAVGYLPEGDMVVVNDAAHLVGRLNVPVVVASTRQTSQGLLVFAHLAESGGHAVNAEPAHAGAGTTAPEH
ncbi:MAG: hypothetical protein WAM97_13305 [Acidimicrobiales bacterium]|jgi:uncharacterized protein YacL